MDHPLRSQIIFFWDQPYLWTTTIIKHYFDTLYTNIFMGHNMDHSLFFFFKLTLAKNQLRPRKRQKVVFILSPPALRLIPITICACFLTFFQIQFFSFHSTFQSLVYMAFTLPLYCNTYHMFIKGCCDCKELFLSNCCLVWYCTVLCCAVPCKFL